MPDKVVSLTTLTDQTVPERSIRQKGTFLQRAGVKLFGWVLMSTLVVVVLLFSYLIWQLRATPALPALAAPTPIDGALLDLLAQQRQQVFQNFLDAVQALVVNVFFPLLTAILGYIFGTNDARRSS